MTCRSGKSPSVVAPLGDARREPPIAAATAVPYEQRPETGPCDADSERVALRGHPGTPGAVLRGQPNYSRREQLGVQGCGAQLAERAR